MNFKNVLGALRTLAVETRGTDPVLTPELRQLFQKALGWLVVGEPDDLEQFAAAVDAVCRKDALVRSQWSRPDDDQDKLVEQLVRCGPASIDDRLLCDALFSFWLPELAERVETGLRQHKSPARIWSQLENEATEANMAADDPCDGMSPEELEEHFRY